MKPAIFDLANLIDFVAGVKGDVALVLLAGLVSVYLIVGAGVTVVRDQCVYGNAAHAPTTAAGVLTWLLWPIYLATRPVAWLRRWRWWRGRKAKIVIVEGEGYYREIERVERNKYLGRDVIVVDGPRKPTPLAKADPAESDPNMKAYVRSGQAAQALGSKVAGQPVTREEFEELRNRQLSEQRGRDAELDHVRNRLAALEAAQPGRGDGAIRVWFVREGYWLASGDTVFYCPRGTSRWTEGADWEIQRMPRDAHELAPGSEDFERIVAEWREATSPIRKSS